MSQHRAGLAAILADGGPDFAFKIAEEQQHRNNLQLHDVIGGLRRERHLFFYWYANGTEYELAIELIYDGPRTAQHEVLRLFELHPQGLWIARLSAGHEQGTLVPFTPPRCTNLGGTLPLIVTVAQQDLTARMGIKPDTDALRLLRLRLGARDVLVAGQRGLAALSEEDACRLTLWAPTGEALETVLKKTAEGAQLVLLGVVPAADAHKAHCLPNLIVLLEAGAVLRVTEDTSASVSAEAAACFFPKRSPLLETWMRYARLEHELAEARLAARMARPLVYSGARQHKKTWQITVALDEQDRKAWFGADPESHHEVQVDQQVALEGVAAASAEDETGGRGQLVIWRMRAEGGGFVTAILKPQRGFRRLPENGRLRAVENIGTKVEMNRRREALELLQAGRAGCPSLMDVLSDPTTAEKPSSVKTRPNQLDDSQRGALAKILGCKDFVAIQGPPGTGKTSVIVEALLNLAEQRKEGAALKVLVSSVQNEAIDNVAERLAKEGILVHQLRRESQDEDEALRRASHQEQTRTDLLKKLQQSLEGKPVIQALEQLRESLSDVDRLRALLADEQASDMQADEISRFCRDTELSTVLRDDGLKLPVLLRTLKPAGQPTGEPSPDMQHDGPPGSPQATAAWWGARKNLWPMATRAPVEASVKRVLSAVQQVERNPFRDQGRVQQSFADLLKLLQKAEQSPLAATAPPVSSPQHVADNWLDRVHEELRKRERELLRYPEVIARRFMDRLREDPAAWRLVQRRHSQTTTATCSMSAQSRDLADEPYDWVVIDEAGRATPLELLVPMVQGRRLVLIGDQRQLPPLLEDEVIAALEREQTPLVDLGQETLFGEIFKNLPRECSERLAVQYRMHANIGRLVSRLFYQPHGETLRSHFTGAHAAKRAPTYGVLHDAPVTFIDTEDLPGSTPYENREERQVVLALLTAFSDAPGVRSMSAPLLIGVICAYARQRDRLIEDFDRLRASTGSHWDNSRLHVEIKTIDAVQGREYPVTIVCLVRRDGKPGFLAAPNRINVALSRAQRQLIVLSTKESLTSPAMKQSASHMARLTESCVQSGWLKRWSEVRL